MAIALASADRAVIRDALTRPVVAAAQAAGVPIKFAVEEAKPRPILLASTAVGGSGPIVLDANAVYGPPTRRVDDAASTMLAAADAVTTDVVAAAGVDAVPDAGVGSDEATLLAVAPAEKEEAIAAPAAVVVPQDDAALVAVAPAVAEDPPEMVAAAPAVEDVPDVVEEPVAEVVAVAPARVATPVAAAVIEPVALADNAVVAAAPVDDAVVAVATPESELVAVSVGREVSAAVDQWRGMWESRDVEGYLDLYHPEAAMGRSGGGRSAGRGQFTKVNLQARVESLFSEYGRIEVSVDNLDLSRDGDLVVSTFDQDLVAWRSDSDASPDYVDRGRKTLVMAQDDSSDWRIVSEKWRPIQ